MLKGAPRLLPNALPTPGPELHIPVLPDEVRELLAVRPGDTVVDCTFGGGGHAALLADDLHGRGRFVAIDRDPDATPQLEAFAHALPTGVELSVLRNSFARALEELAERRLPRRRDPVRPGRLVDAARPARARLLLRHRRAARHAHGSARRAERGRPRERVERGAIWRAPSRATARSASRGRSRGRSCAAAPSGRSCARSTWSTRCAERSRRLRASARDTRPSASSRRCASPSTTS